MDKEYLAFLGGLVILAIVGIILGVSFISAYSFWDLVDPVKAVSVLLVLALITACVVVVFIVLAFMVYQSVKGGLDMDLLNWGVLIILLLIFLILGLVDVGINVVALIIPSLGAGLETVGETVMELLQFIIYLISLFVVYFTGKR